MNGSAQGPQYVARKSIFGTYGGRIIFCVLLCWLIIPVFIAIRYVIKAATYRLEFYRDKIIVRSGLIATKEKRIVLTPVMGVRINYSLLGRIFNYGDVFIDTVGRWDIDTSGIKRPEELRAFLESLIDSQAASGFSPTHIIAN